MKCWSNWHIRHLLESYFLFFLTPWFTLHFPWKLSCLGIDSISIMLYWMNWLPKQMNGPCKNMTKLCVAEHIWSGPAFAFWTLGCWEKRLRRKIDKALAISLTLYKLVPVGILSLILPWNHRRMGLCHSQFMLLDKLVTDEMISEEFFW